MAKQLIIVRHGKAENQHPDGSDFERNLTERGRNNSAEMAERMKIRALIPDYLLSSPAPRALQTCEIFAEVWNMDKQAITTDESIYEAPLKALLKAVNALPDSSVKAAMFGHNPGVAQLALTLTDADIYDVPTAGVVVINFNADAWAEISANTGTMLLFDYPEHPFTPARD
ncbi:SixA phosphatase family protein [Pedobacter duraquae]|uniref:Phosphohistidine phosphatase SixA n=1 Tax=Pedobacter duraquae TaxID=425511 RepID=A0A4R6IL08_9SPHI|nr:histidine phosphatase family protein [Pedobacter duraquae]TDO22753.1 phosphohistidine phosphatase SixA [Pedobacter duraquae]